MRFDKIQATAFGALRGPSLEFPERMTIVHGPNEAGKSTWFAAMFAGLTGRRVARGRGTKAQQEFRRRHKPWVGSQWRVTCDIALDSGLRLSFEHDLQAGTVRITDRGLDRFIPLPRLEQQLGVTLQSDEGFDGSALLGLNRESVRSTMFVGQADILDVLINAGELQEFVQRAAATGHVDATAEQALEWIAEQRRERVGSPHIGNRPLRATSAALDAARKALGDAIDARHNVQDLRIRLGGSRTELARRESELGDLRNAVEWFEIDALAKRIDRARELNQQIGSLAQSPAPAAQELISRVTTVAEAFRSRGVEPTPLEGDSAETIRAEIDALPDMPAGDRQPAPAAIEAERALNDAEAALETLRATAPSAVEEIETDASADEIRVLAERLAEPEPTLAPGTQLRIEELEAQHRVSTDEYAQRRQEYDRALAHYAEQQREYAGQRELYETARATYEADYRDFQSQVAAKNTAYEAQRTADAELAKAEARRAEQERAATRRRGVGIGLTAAGAIAIIIGVIGLVLGIPFLALGLGLAGVAAAVPGLVLAVKRRPSEATTPQPRRIDIPSVREEPVRPTPPEPPQPVTLAAPGEAPPRPAALVDAEQRLAHWQTSSQEHKALRDQAEARIAELRLPSDPSRLREIARSLDDRAAAQDRARRHAEQTAAAEQSATKAAQTLLAAVGGSSASDVSVEDARRMLADYVSACAERDRLGRLAERREELVRILDQRVQREGDHARALAAFHRTATDVAALAAELALPVASEDDGLAQLDAWHEEQRRLARVVSERVALEGRLEQLLDGTSVDDLIQDHSRRIADAGPRPEAVDPTAAARLAEVEARRDAAAAEVARQEGRLREVEESLTSIPEAMERAALAERDAERVRNLDQYLALAETHLAIAKERAHADIAPVLENTIRPWLPRITGGKYVDVAVDPATLMVRAVEPGGRARDADILSHGTTEQVFLLLRIALAQHLASTDEVAPLILDDVTVQSDRQRTEAILELLHEISKDRQVIFFTQELEVISWALQNLPERAVVGL